MNRYSGRLASLALIAAGMTAGVTGVSQGAANADSCGPLPGGGFVYSFNTLDSSPARTGYYESCPVSRTYAAGASVPLACKFTNSYGNLWYKVSNNLFIYSSHFSASVKSSNLSTCN